MSSFSVAAAVALALTGAFSSTPELREQDRAALSSTAGEYEGSLSYTDFGTGKRVEIPARLSAQAAPDGSYICWNLAFTDPGYKVYSISVATVSSETGQIRVVSSGGGEIQPIESWDVAERAWESEGDWMLTAERDGSDNGRPARLRMVWSLVDDRLSSAKYVDYRDDEDEQWFQRNELAVRRVAGDE